MSLLLGAEQGVPPSRWTSEGQSRGVGTVWQLGGRGVGGDLMLGPIALMLLSQNCQKLWEL